MTKVNGRMVISISKWRISAGKSFVWCVGWAYAFNMMSEARLDRIVNRVAHWVVVGGAIARIEWDDE